MVVDEGAVFLLLPLEEPVTDFKDQIRKLGLMLQRRPGAEGLHQPRHLSKITQISKPMAIVAERPFQFQSVDLGELGLSRDRQRQQYLSGKIVLKAVVYLGSAPVGENIAVLANRGPQGLSESAYLG